MPSLHLRNAQQVMDSMIDVETLPEVSLSYSDEIVYGEALAHVISAASVLKGLGEYDEEAKEVVLKYFDMWLNTIKPIMYKNGMAEVIGSKLRGGLVELFNSITEDELGDLLSSITDLKNSENFDMNDVKELLYYTAKLLEGMGVSLYDLKDYLIYDDPRLLLEGIAATVALTLGIILMRE